MNQRGRIKLITSGGFVKNSAVYTCISERNAIIDSWRILYGQQMWNWLIQIYPFDSVNLFKWSRKR